MTLFKIFLWIKYPFLNFTDMATIVGVSWPSLFRVTTITWNMARKPLYTRKQKKKRYAGSNNNAEGIERHCLLSSFPQCPCHSHSWLPSENVHTVIFLDETSNYEKSKITGKLMPPRKTCAEITDLLLLSMGWDSSGRRSTRAEIHQSLPPVWRTAKVHFC